MLQGLPWEDDNYSDSQGIPHFYEMWKFISVLATVHNCTLSQASSTVSTQPSSLWAILILSFLLSLCLSKSLLYLGCLAKVLYTFHISLMLAACPTHLTILHLITKCVRLFRLTGHSEFKWWTNGLNKNETPVFNSYAKPACQLIPRLFNNSASYEEVLQYQMRCEDDHEWL